VTGMYYNCNGCDRWIDHTDIDQWEDRDLDRDLCKRCYIQAVNNGEDVSDYKHRYIPEINLMEWVVFMEDTTLDFGSSRFLVNCNPESADYGKIMTSVEDHAGVMKLEVMSIDIIADISAWFGCTQTVENEMEMILDMYNYSHDSIERIELESDENNFEKKIYSLGKYFDVGNRSFTVWFYIKNRFTWLDSFGIWDESEAYN
jgi:hypothetical protein